MPEGFQHQIESQEGATVVRFAGELDLAEEQQAGAALAGVDSADSVIVDLSELDFIDSSGIRVLIEAAQRVRDAGGRFAVAGAGGDVQRVLELVEVGDLIPMFASVDEARAGAA